jgi:NAD(P)-dependent dehydrogenase (short-subunit alcohol dehydrogenase family)
LRGDVSVTFGRKCEESLLVAEIIGSGKIGSALARAFARRNIKVGIANTRGPASLAALTKELGANVIPQSLREAHEAEVIFLAVPFSAYKDVARQREQWDGRIIIDTMNTLHTRPEELGGQLSSELVSEAFAGAHLVNLPGTPIAGNGEMLPLETVNERFGLLLSSGDHLLMVRKRLQDSYEETTTHTDGLLVASSEAVVVSWFEVPAETVFADGPEHEVSCQFT